MNTLRVLVILSTAFLLAASGPCYAFDEPGCNLIINLKDGSRISGRSLDAAWQFHSSILGDVKLNIAGIRSIEMATNVVTAQLTGTNGDKLTVRFVSATLPVDSIFGKIDVPVNSIRTIEVLGAGNPKTLPAGLVALWSAEGDGADSIGEHNAIPQGNVTYEPGLVGRAFGLDGHSAYLRIPASPQLDVGAGDGLTITAWIRPSTFDETPGHGARGPIVEWDSDTTDGVSLWANGGNSLTGHLKTQTADGRVTALQTANGALRSGQWQLVAFTYDKESGSATLYIDGVAVKSDNFGSVRAETTYPINIGRRTGQPIGNGDSFGGLVDELALYNRALTAAELQGVFKAAAQNRTSEQPATVRHIISKKGKQPKTPKRPNVQMATAAQTPKASPQLIGWWPLSEGEGTLVNDHSSSKPPHDGQILSGMSGPSDGLKPIEDPKVWDNSEKGRECLALDGRHYVSLGNIYQGRYEEITIACWIKHERSGWQDVVERGSWGGPDGIGLCMDYNGTSVTFGHYEQAVSSHANVQDNQWHHVAGTMRRSGVDYVYSIYVDGKLDNTATNAWGLGATTGKWTIGARDGGTWSYRGLVSDVRLYDGALTEADIKKIFLEKNYQQQASIPAPSSDTKNDPIGKLTQQLDATHGEWVNGLSPNLDLLQTATSHEVLLKIIAANDLGTNVRTIEIRKTCPIHVGAADGEHYTAALVELDAGKRIILFRWERNRWWSRVFELP
ncbi:MAG: LamG domain-containing protein [Verrucomicrobia bacterium]|nr:LamG domain-containing protein [Verrucomicrobiota bacterium]